MTTFSKGLMIALSLCLLLALNASFAQEDSWETVAVYMVDPIDEKVSLGVREYVENLTRETFENDFILETAAQMAAREAQLAQVEAENEARIRAAARFLENDLFIRGDGTSMWYPSWIPLGLAETTEDSLFKNVLEIEGPMYSAGPRAGERQTLREFFEADGCEPAGLNADGSQRWWCCDRPRCRKENYAHFWALLEIHDQSLVSVTAPRIISFTVRARWTETFVDESVDEQAEQVGVVSAEFDYDSIRLLQPAVMDPDESVIDLAPYWKPAAKATASAKASSWGRIKATFADD